MSPGRQTSKKIRPRVILDIACGTCRGIKYDLQRINWSCLVILTDLSHRILKYNKQYFSEEMVNPYVDIVCMACDCAHLPNRDGCIDMVVSNWGFGSMQTKMLDGFREGYRVLKPDGHAVYNVGIVGDHDSENTKKWERLCRPLAETYHLHENLFDIEEWKEMVFPFENEILQWTGEYLCISRK